MDTKYEKGAQTPEAYVPAFFQDEDLKRLGELGRKPTQFDVCDLCPTAAGSCRACFPEDDSR